MTTKQFDLQEYAKKNLKPLEGAPVRVVNVTRTNEGSTCVTVALTGEAGKTASDKHFHVNGAGVSQINISTPDGCSELEFWTSINADVAGDADFSNIRWRLVRFGRKSTLKLDHGTHDVTSLLGDVLGRSKYFRVRKLRGDDVEILWNS